MRRYVLIGIVVALLVLAGILGYTLYSNVKQVLNTDRIYKGIYIENTPVGGLTRAEAYELLENTYLEPLRSKKIEVEVDGNEYKLDYASLDIKINIGEAIEQAYSIGRKGNISRRFREIRRVYDHPVVIRLKFEYNEGKLKEFVDELFSKSASTNSLSFPSLYSNLSLITTG